LVHRWAAEPLAYQPLDVSARHGRGGFTRYGAPYGCCHIALDIATRVCCLLPLLALAKDGSMKWRWMVRPVQCHGMVLFAQPRAGFFHSIRRWLFWRAVLLRLDARQPRWQRGQPYC
jgi:hypothetical protein